MITLLSPTKTQSTFCSINQLSKTKPIAFSKAHFLMSLLNKLSTEELSKMMKTSSSLTINTKKLIHEWINNESITQAIYLFQGDAFQKLDALSLSADQLNFSQEHLIILSALYGYLKPFDLVSCYRLDMKDSLKIPEYSNLYHYWKETITSGLNNLISNQKNKIILNLASQEYADMIDHKKIDGKIVNVDFKVNKDNTYKTVGIYAKRGRGLLTRYILQNKIDTPEQLIAFNTEGFQFSEALSTPDNHVFTLTTGE